MCPGRFLGVVVDVVDLAVIVLAHVPPLGQGLGLGRTAVVASKARRVGHRSSLESLGVQHDVDEHTFTHTHLFFFSPSETGTRVALNSIGRRPRRTPHSSSERPESRDGRAGPVKHQHS